MSPPSASPHLEADRLEALQVGSDPSDDEAMHLLDCPTCSARVEAVLDALGSLPVPLGWDDSSPIDLPGLEARLLAAAAKARRAPTAPPFRIAVGAFFLAAAAIGVIAVNAREHAQPAIPPSHATVLLAASASFSPVQTGADEVLGLRGEATISVRKLEKGERFRARIGPDEVEVRGTRFTLREADGGLSEVEVYEGTVEVRAVCCPTATLHGGDRWARPAKVGLTGSASPAPGPSAPALPEASAGGAAELASAPAPAIAAPPRGAESSGIALLAQGTAAYDAGRFAAAAVLLSKAISAEPGAAWARDAATLAGAARVLSTPIDGIPTLAVSVASFDTAAARARRQGDPRIASAAAFGAARHLPGKAATARFCALQGEGALSSGQRAEAAGKCAR